MKIREIVVRFQVKHCPLYPIQEEVVTVETCRLCKYNQGVYFEQHDHFEIDAEAKCTYKEGKDEI